MSCTLRISNAAHSALLAGDIEQGQEARLIERHNARVSEADAGPLHTALKADVLLVPHHGSNIVLHELLSLV